MNQLIKGWKDQVLLPELTDHFSLLRMEQPDIICQYVKQYEEHSTTHKIFLLKKEKFTTTRLAEI